MTETKNIHPKIYEFKYGKGTVSFELNSDDVLYELTAQPSSGGLTEQDEIARALANPIGTHRLSEIVHKGEKICIITSDITRPCPTYRMLPPVIEELLAAGIFESDITLVFALGIHRRHTREEMKKLTGEGMMDRIKMQDSDPDVTTCMGFTTSGTPVNITKVVADADRRICLGNIEMHYFAGYSGGGKAIMPGVSDRAAIQSNHSRMVESTSVAGRIEGNRVRMDIEEAADLCGIDFILNVILDEKKTIVKAVAGDHRAAHREGCRFLDQMYKIHIPALADVVIASSGGFPKDINLYQAQKALDNAQHAVRKGGVIILVADCSEGFGEKVFEEWLSSTERSSDLITRIKTQFQLGGHKAAAIAMVLEKCEVYLVSALDPEKAAMTFMKPFNEISQAIQAAQTHCGGNSRIILMPQAGSTLPIIG